MDNSIKNLTVSDNLTKNKLIIKSTPQNALNNFYSTVGEMRHQTENIIIEKFNNAYTENPTHAMKLLFWLRDIKYGVGERRAFRIIISSMASKQQFQSLKKNLHHISEYGRWDDLKYLFKNTKSKQIKKIIVNLFKIELNNGNQLLAKWLPRKGFTAKQLRQMMKFTPKEYRKLLVNLSNTVEQKMCAKQWNKINFDDVPSLAMNRYIKAFQRNTKTSFNNWILNSSKNKSDVKFKHIHTDKYLTPYSTMADIISSTRYKIIKA